MQQLTTRIPHPHIIPFVNTYFPLQRLLITVAVFVAVVACGGETPSAPGVVGSSASPAVTTPPTPTSLPGTAPVPTAKSPKDAGKTLAPEPGPSPKPTPTLAPATNPIPSPNQAVASASGSSVANVSLIDAISQGNVEVVQQHLAAGANPDTSFVPQSAPRAGGSALHLAVLSNDQKMVQLLLEAGATKDIKAKDKTGGTPLQWAAFFGKAKMVEFMLMIGADMNIADNSGCTALCAAMLPNPYVEDTEAFRRERKSIQALLEPTPDPKSSSSDTQQHAPGPPEKGLKLQNLLIKNLGPYDASSSKFGDLVYNEKFDKLVLDTFGYIHNLGKPDQYDNPTFEFKAPADTVVIAPVSGRIYSITWQPTKSYLQDDWDILIRPSEHSEWAVNVDHLVSIDCDRSGKAPVLCDKPLKVGGQVVFEGMPVQAGQVLGYVGNWPDYNDAGINGRVELTLYEYIFKDGISGPGRFLGVTNQCPTMHLAKEVESSLAGKITDLMSTYEAWSGDSSIYEQEKMVAPGCLYSAIVEIDGKTEPIKEE